MTTTIIRCTTLALGLIFSLLLTAQLLAGVPKSEFWNEALNGSGFNFVIYAFPYILFAIVAKTKSVRKLRLRAAPILALGAVMTAISFAPKPAVRPEDVPIFDPMLWLVFVQIVICFSLIDFRQQGINVDK